MYTRFILPNIGKPSKLKVVPKQYGNIEQADWDKFVEHRLSDKFKGMSESAKASRAKHKYPHRMGRAGYVGLRKKMIKNKEIREDEVPTRSVMWCKARETKDGGYEDDELKDKVDEIVNHEKEIHDGSLKLEHGTDALTLVLGKEHPGCVRGVGKGMTPTRYWNLPRRRGSSRNCTLQRQLDDEKRENAEKVGGLQKQLQDQDHVIKEQGQKLKDQDHVIKEQGQVMKAILAHLSSKGIGLPDLEVPLNMSSDGQNSLKSGLPASHETPATSNHSDRSVQDDTIAKSSKRPRKSSAVDHQPLFEDTRVAISSPSQVLIDEGSVNIKCKLAYPDLRNIVAHGTIIYSSSRQNVHGVSLQADCYKVSIDKTIKPAAFLPIQSREHKTVEEAYKSFVAWPKSLVIPDSKVPQTTSGEHKEQEKQNKKTKRSFITVNQLKVPKHTRSTSNKKNIDLDDA
ncbi:hypothetical protein OSB04_024145 [Centaurea solstitialis]|uniref:DUF8039 domain-containing protein n=1 Tax=Centaurea solstitialis TaxID=347529 RepID=A0AA38SL66_9ASTR|nr:hypothetical protein OSB04_024145 [Centaurea solstitialis]